MRLDTARSNLMHLALALSRSIRLDAFLTGVDQRTYTVHNTSFFLLLYPILYIIEFHLTIGDFTLGHIFVFVNINIQLMGWLFLQNKDIPQARLNLACGINIFLWNICAPSCLSKLPVATPCLDHRHSWGRGKLPTTNQLTSLRLVWQT
jgi:hypothetical protein